MELHKITDLADLARFTPKLLELHTTLEGRWAPELDGQEFLYLLVNNFANPDSWYFGDIDESGKVLYFVIITKQEKGRCNFWLFYTDRSFWKETASIIKQLSVYAKARGITACYSMTTRNTRSYERWLKKFGAQRMATMYKFDLTKF